MIEPLAYARLAVLVGALALVTSCTSPNSSESTAAPWDPYGLVPTEGEYRQIIEKAVRSMARLPITDESAEAQRDYFADGEIVYAEYEAATFAYASCLRDKGLEVLGPVNYRNGGGLLVIAGFDPANSLDVLVMNPPDWDYTPDLEWCMSVWLERVERVWMDQHEPTVTDIEQWQQAAWDCARERDLPLSNPPTLDDAHRAVREGCEPWLALRGG